MALPPERWKGLFVFCLFQQNHKICGVHVGDLPVLFIRLIKAAEPADRIPWGFLNGHMIGLPFPDEVLTHMIRNRRVLSTRMQGRKKGREACSTGASGEKDREKGPEKFSEVRGSRPLSG